MAAELNTATGEATVDPDFIRRAVELADLNAVRVALYQHTHDPELLDLPKALELALQCSFLVASENARFADTHARVGIMPGGGITVLLAQSIGLRRAIEMSLTGNFVPADEAERLGLVNHVVPHEELLPFVRALAADIVSNDQIGVQRLVQHYRAVANAATLDEAHLLEGLMAETWAPGVSFVAERRADVTARGRAQTT